MSLGLEIRKARVAKGLQQKSLSEQLGVAQKHLSQVECGHIDPRFSFVQRIAKTLGVSLDQLGQESGQEDTHVYAARAQRTE